MGNERVCKGGIADAEKADYVICGRNTKWSSEDRQKCYLAAKA